MNYPKGMLRFDATGIIVSKRFGFLCLDRAAREASISRDYDVSNRERL